jgi:uncharacterized protein YdaT
MPWTSSDVHKHNKKAAKSSKARAVWVKVANAQLKEHGDEGRAIRVANSVADRVHASDEMPGQKELSDSFKKLKAAGYKRVNEKASNNRVQSLFKNDKGKKIIVDHRIKAVDGVPLVSFRSPIFNEVHTNVNDAIRQNNRKILASEMSNYSTVNAPVDKSNPESQKMQSKPQFINSPARDEPYTKDESLNQAVDEAEHHYKTKINYAGNMDIQLAPRRENPTYSPDGNTPMLASTATATTKDKKIFTRHYNAMEHHLTEAKKHKPQTVDYLDNFKAARAHDKAGTAHAKGHKDAENLSATAFKLSKDLGKEF